MVINLLLVLISLAVIFFGFGLGSFLSIVGITLISFYAAKGLKGKHKKLIFFISIVFTTFYMIALKALPIAYNEENSVRSFIEPFGLTFYMMQVISYLIDVYRGEYECETNIIKYALYTTYIPHLFVGPVYSYDMARDNLIRAKDFSWKNVVGGILRACWGLFKIFVIGNRLSVLTSSIAELPIGGFYVVIALLVYGIQMFALFSGGVDIALGVSRIFDIELPDNFNSPFLAESVFDFWERWQTTIVNWVQKYIFNSSKKKKATKKRQVFNVLFAYFMIGFLLGNKFIIWAIINGLLTLFGNKLKTSKKFLNRFLTYLAISITWAFVIWPNGFSAFAMLASIFTKHNFTSVLVSLFNLGLTGIDFLLLGFGLLTMFIIDDNLEKVRKELKNYSLKFQIVLITILVLVTIFAGIN